MSNYFVEEYSSLHFAQFAAVLQVRNWEHLLPPMNFDRLFLDGFFLGSFFFGHFFRARRCVRHSFALVRIELLLNPRLPELTRVGRELSTARFANSE